MRVKSKKKSGELYKYLYQTERGCVYRNSINENLFLLDFGNMFIRLSKANFISFRAFITKIKLAEIHNFIVQPSNKIIVQPIKSMRCYAFTESQFIELQELIFKSFDRIEIEDEINLLLNAS